MFEEEEEKEEEEEEEEEGGISLEEAGAQNTRRVAPSARRAVEERIGDPASSRRVEVISDSVVFPLSPRDRRLNNRQI